MIGPTQLNLIPTHPTLEFVTLPGLSDPGSSALSVHYGLALIKGERYRLIDDTKLLLTLFATQPPQGEV